MKRLQNHLFTISSFLPLAEVINPNFMRRTHRRLVTGFSCLLLAFALYLNFVRKEVNNFSAPGVNATMQTNTASTEQDNSQTPDNETVVLQ